MSKLLSTVGAVPTQDSSQAVPISVRSCDQDPGCDVLHLERVGPGQHEDGGPLLAAHHGRAPVELDQQPVESQRGLLRRIAGTVSSG